MIDNWTSSNLYPDLGRKSLTTKIRQLNVGNDVNEATMERHVSPAAIEKLPVHLCLTTRSASKSTDFYQFQV
jgi:hypothetical protein